MSYIISQCFDIVKNIYENMYKRKSKLSFIPINVQDNNRYNLNSGKTYIDEFLNIEARYLHIVNEVSTHIIKYEDDVIGFYSLSVNSTEFECELRGKKVFNCIQLDYIAVDKSYQGQGVGNVILNNVKYMCSEIADKIGCRGILTCPDNDVVEWYKKNGFQSIGADYDGNDLYFFDFRDQQLYSEVNKQFYE